MSQQQNQNQNQVVIFKSKNDGTVFSNVRTVKTIASFVNDHKTLCRLAQVCRWTGEFVDDDIWKGLAGLQDHYHPPPPFPSFVSFFRTFVLQHHNSLDDDDDDNDSDGFTAGIDGVDHAHKSSGAQGRLARASLAHIVVPKNVQRKGQKLTGESIVSNPSIVRFGPHIKSAHVLLIDRPEHVLVGYCTKDAPSASHSVDGPCHQFFALPFMLRGFIVQISLVEEEEQNTSSASENKTKNKEKKKYFRVKRTEFNLEEKVLLNVEVRAGPFDQLAVCLAANNSSCAII